ncbi:MAG: DEAD/DEAH box helicase, partial [Solirubrobacteraceae bacterium]
MTEIGARFAQFFAAVNKGHSPYPWQTALVEQIALTGEWPNAIAAPTGAGKTAVIDVHVFLVAERERQRQCADEDGQPLRVARPPRRLVLVAPRRVLVDDQFERACKLAKLLIELDDPVVVEVAEALQRLQTISDQERNGSSPLGVAQLRGGVRLDLTWRLDPAQCQIICATPQMWGSRLLMRGYRGSRGTRNLESGLIGHDVVAVIDEAHLHERLIETAIAVAAKDPLSKALHVVAMSATQQAEQAVGLTDEDFAHEELERRVRAAKRVEIVEINDWEAKGAVA